MAYSLKRDKKRTEISARKTDENRPAYTTDVYAG